MVRRTWSLLLGIAFMKYRDAGPAINVHQVGVNDATITLSTLDLVFNPVSSELLLLSSRGTLLFFLRNSLTFSFHRKIKERLGENTK